MIRKTKQRKGQLYQKLTALSKKCRSASTSCSADMIFVCLLNIIICKAGIIVSLSEVKYHPHTWVFGLMVLSFCLFVRLRMFFLYRHCKGRSLEGKQGRGKGE